jgi:hypothetical protein
MNWCGFELLHQFFNKYDYAHKNPTYKIHSDEFKVPKLKTTVSFPNEATIYQILCISSIDIFAPTRIITKLHYYFPCEHPNDQSLESFPNKASPA